MMVRRPLPLRRPLRRPLRWGERGIALVVVLWALTVIAVISANFTTANRDGLLLARNTVERAKAEALADAGVYRAVLAIVNQEPEPEAGDAAGEDGASGDAAPSLNTVRTGPNDEDEQFGEFGPPTWRANGKVYDWPLADGVVSISIQDEAGKIDINGAPDDLLEKLFRAAGLSEEETLVMVDRLIDYRDTDAERRPFGAEDIDYRRADMDYGAKDRPFERTDELRRVLGMTPELYSAVEPLITVHSRQRGVDPDVAQAAVLAVLGAASVAADTTEPPAQTAPRATRTDRRRDRASSRQRAFTITAEARTAGGGVFVRQAVIELTGNRDRPIDIRQWDQARGRLMVEAR